MLEAAVGGAIALFWVHLRGEVGRGFTLFTGICYLTAAALAIWLRSAFPPLVSPQIDQATVVWFATERTFSLAFVVLLSVYLISLRSEAWKRINRLVGPLVPLLGLASVWSAALVDANPQLFGLASPLAVLGGTMALGSALTGLSLGHWYLVSPTLSVRPLIELTLLCFGTIVAQAVLLPLLVFAAASPTQQQALLTEHLVFLGVRVVFGLVVPLALTLMTWRTARIRSLDSATGLLYIVAALVLAGEISARTLFFLTGVAT